MVSEKKDTAYYLRKIIAKRRELKISPQNMAQLSKMNKDYVSAIEVGEFDKLPVGYEKMFVRTYLKLLKFESVDIDEMISVFFESIVSEQKPQQASKISEIKHHTYDQPSLDLVQIKKVIIWLPAVIVLVLLFYLVYVNLDTVDNPETVQEVSMETSMQMMDSIDQEAVEILNESDSLELRITVLKPVFIFLSIDSVVQHRVRSVAGKSYLFKAKDQFNLYASNGDHLSASLNDSNFGVLSGPNTRISYMIFEKNGIISKGIVPIETKIDSLTANN